MQGAAAKTARQEKVGLEVTARSRNCPPRSRVRRKMQSYLDTPSIWQDRLEGTGFPDELNDAAKWARSLEYLKTL